MRAFHAGLTKQPAYRPSVIALISRGQTGHTIRTQSVTLPQEHSIRQFAQRLCCTIMVTRHRSLRKKYTWLVQSIFPASSASEIRARTSPPMSAGEIVFSSTKITPPCDRSSSAQSFRNGGIVLPSYLTKLKRCFAASNKQTESSLPRKFPLSHRAIGWTTSDRFLR